MTRVFDAWPEAYDQWFETPIGRLIKAYETTLLLDMLDPDPQADILDAGCGTGVFTQELLLSGATVVGLELSFPMILKARQKLKHRLFWGIQGDMRHLPFQDHRFEHTVSVTAIEFLRDAKPAVDELFRVTRPGGKVVVATLNRLSPWSTRRKASGKAGHTLFKHAVFRSPEELAALSSFQGEVKTAIHFEKDDSPEKAEEIEADGRARGLYTGAFVVARWIKPGPRPHPVTHFDSRKGSA